MPDTHKHDSAYFADQWAKLQKGEKDRQAAWYRKWLADQGKNEGRAPYSAWMVIPCNTADYGIRPLAAGMPYWASPFIEVTSPDPSGHPLAGAPNMVSARVFNLGAAIAAPTRVTFYWVDPSVGLGEADAHPIGTEIVQINPMSSALVTCSTPWVPSYLNGGHECLFVSADNHVLDPLLLPFQPWADRHVGQRNVSVMPAQEQQMLQLWLPGGRPGLTGEIRVLALRAIAPQGFAHGRTPVQTLAAAAHAVLAGHHAPPRGRGKEPPKPPAVIARRVKAETLIAGHRLLEETRRAGTSRHRADKAPADMPAALGDPLFRFTSATGEGRLMELHFAPVALGYNEIALLNITCVVEGVVEGGYVVVLANPAWFKDSHFHSLGNARTGGSMSKDTNAGFSPGRADLRDLVIRHNRVARTTLEIAEQLAPHLPIESFKALPRGIKVSGGEIPAELLESQAGGFLPIRDADELVLKVSAILTLFAHNGEAQRPTLSVGAARLLDHLKTPEGGKPPIQTLVGRHSLFPVKKEG